MSSPDPSRSASPGRSTTDPSDPTASGFPSSRPPQGQVSAFPLRLLFQGQDFILLIDTTGVSYQIVRRKDGHRVTLAGQSADQLAKALDRIGAHFANLGDPRAEARFVRLVDVVLSGFLAPDRKGQHSFGLIASNRCVLR